jgi:hypothetical protein
MAKPKRSPAQALEDYPVIERLALRGLTQKEIAKELSKIRPYSLTQQTISSDMVKLRELWKESSVIDIDVEKGKLKAHYEYLIAEAQKAWERSQKNAVTVTEAETEKGTFITTKTEGQVGDSRFLAEIRALRAEYKNLFGLDAPRKNEVTGKDGKDLPAQAVMVYLPENNRDSNNT